MMQVSILITSFMRPHLLKWNLRSLACQTIPYTFETIVLNDGIPDQTEDICRQYQDKLNLKYLFTGQRNTTGCLVYRVPGFALNIGIRAAAGPVLIISCAEMFHLNNTVWELACPTLSDPKILSTSIGMDDTGSFLDDLEAHHGLFQWDDYYTRYPTLNTRLPFLMAIDHQELINIGGYDEDFTGFAFDDDDVVHRLTLNGCHIALTQAQTIHLYHPRHDDTHVNTPEYRLNQKLFVTRKKQIVRNQGRYWGYMEAGPN